MPIQNSPYDAFSKLLSTSGHPCSPAELHGVLLGRSCTGVGFDADNWLADVAELLETEPTENVRNALIGLQEMVKGELTGDDVTVVNSMTVFAFDADAKIRHLDVYLQSG